MLKNLLFAVIFFSTSQIVYCQSLAIQEFKKQLQADDKQDTTKVNLLNQIGFSYWIYQADSSEVYGTNALKLASEIKYLPGMAYANRIIGVAHWARGNYEGGLKHLLESQKLYQLLEDSLGIANSTMNIGLIYSDQGEIDKALNHFLEAFHTFERLDKAERMINTANHIGKAYYRDNNYNKAFEYYQLALKLSKEVNSIYGSGTALHNLGVLYKAQNKLDSAKILCLESMEYQQKFSDRVGFADNYETLGDIFFEMGDYNKAKSYYEEGVEKAKLVSSKKILSNIYSKLKEISVIQKNYNQALEYQEAYTALQDSMMNIEKMRAMVWLENKNELERKNQEITIREQKITLLRKEQQLNNLWLNIFAISFVLVIILGFLIYRIQKIKHDKDKQLFLNEQVLNKTKMENQQLKQEELTRELRFKNKELTSYTLNFIQKNELMEELKLKIIEIKKAAPKDLSKPLNSLYRQVEGNFHNDRDWEDFKLYFENVHKDFFTSLKDYCPELTQSELKLCALLRLNMNLKEAATILGIAPESVKTARYRLRKKLNLEREDNLIDIILQVEKMNGNLKPETSKT
ncbi:tetratricopeptide repeat protein [Chondrinema litorale]|uniref:tetratricopeptide repeat protein n=1 Tax=Chondrinema litorale TaxID=2994555 RepID=UPI002542D6F6|nr:tetratricopeptide repeat protein [Chondrinema litorale]UZR99306.1 tetratricopeptide repeat protein [Chondrinema litorale]